MNLTVLGSGTCIPNNKRGSSGYLLELNEKLILLDCGNGATWKLEKIGINYLEVDHIFITHFHPDHTADLIPFLFATKNPFHKKRIKPLNIWGPDGFEKFMNKMINLFGEWISPDYLKVNEIKSDKVVFEDFEVRVFKTVHTDNSVGYIFNSDNKKLIYTGDTGYFEQLGSICDNADLLITECSLPNKQKVKNHLSPNDINKLVERTNIKKILLTHIYPAMEDKIQKELNSESNSEIVLAEDFLRVENF